MLDRGCLWSARSLLNFFCDEMLPWFAANRPDTFNDFLDKRKVASIDEYKQTAFSTELAGDGGSDETVLFMNYTGARIDITLSAGAGTPLGLELETARSLALCDAVRSLLPPSRRFDPHGQVFLSRWNARMRRRSQSPSRRGRAHEALTSGWRLRTDISATSAPRATSASRPPHNSLRRHPISCVKSAMRPTRASSSAIRWRHGAAALAAEMRPNGQALRNRPALQLHSWAFWHHALPPRPLRAHSSSGLWRPATPLPNRHLPAFLETPQALSKGFPQILDGHRRVETCRRCYFGISCPCRPSTPSLFPAPRRHSLRQSGSHLRQVTTKCLAATPNARKRPMGWQH